MTLLCNTIMRHEGKRASVKGDTLLVEDKPVSAYTFEKNYYWMASNNPINLCDSRLFGLVPVTPFIHQNPLALIEAVFHAGRRNGAGGESECLYQQHQNDCRKHCLYPY